MSIPTAAMTATSAYERRNQRRRNAASTNRFIITNYSSVILSKAKNLKIQMFRIRST